MKVPWPARFSYGRTASPPSLPFHRPLSFGLVLVRASHLGGAHGVLGVDSWGWFSYKIRWRLWSRTARRGRSGGKAFCSTKRFLWHKNTPCPAFGPYAKRQLNSQTFNSAAKLCRLCNPLVIRDVGTSSRYFPLYP